MIKSLVKVLVAVCLLSLWMNPAFGFSTHNAGIVTSFDKLETPVDNSITITASLFNFEFETEEHELRGLYYTEQIPEGLTVNTVSVKIDGSDISNYIFEAGSVGDIYPGYIPCRWILETPTIFDENNPVGYDSTVEIVYSVSSSEEGTFNFDEFNWVGYYQNADVGQRAAFGHSEDGDKETISFFANALTVTIPANATEADGVLTNQGTVTIPGTLVSDLTVSLSSNDTSEVTVPTSVIISAGTTSKDFDVTIVDDSEIDGTQSAIVTASATGWTQGTDTIDVADNDDSDGDEMPDWWEQQIVNADPNDPIESIDDVLPGDDFDGDGYSNLTEYLNGWDPTDPNDPGCIDMDLMAGWNLISLSVTPDDASLTALFPDAEVAYGFDGSYFVATSLEPGKGYWVKVPSAQTYTICGQNFATYTVDTMSEGWHLMGAVNCTTTPETDPAGCIDVMYGFSGSYFDTTEFESGNGCWVKVNQECEFTVHCQ